MLLAALRQVEKVYGEQVVLDNATLELRASDRTALIGRNGSGKSTILNLLVGYAEQDAGEVYRRQDVTTAKLEQDPQFEPGVSITAVSDNAFKDLDELEKKIEMLEQQGLDKADIYEAWETLHERFTRRGGYERRSRRDSVLFALGFRGREEQEAVSLSGGEKTRLGLAMLLMAQPDVLLLDEPTNHLDMDMRAWLESYLNHYPGAVLIVSHDRLFLDKACSSTAEISLGKLRTYDGTPSQYRDYRIEQLRIEEATRKNQQKEHERLEAAATQMKKWAGQNAKLHRRAKAMFKRLDRYETSMIGEADPTERTTRFSFPCNETGDIVMQTEHLSKQFGDKQLFKDVRFTLRKGERIALVGPNGAGKSSFLKVILGNLPSDNPKARLHYGSRVRLGYYDQELGGINPDNTLIEEMIKLVGDREAHNLLGNFMFPFDAQYKRIADLSGGERARLALLKLTLGEYSFLVLDEPTNHLDVEMIEALETALNLYEGTLLIVSHDRQFIENTTELIWELRSGSFTAFEGDWDYYQYKRGQEEAKQKAIPKSKPKADPSEDKLPSKWQLEQDKEKLEAEISSLESSLSEVNGKLADTAQLSPEDIIDLGNKHDELDTQLLATIAQWEKVMGYLELKEA